MGPPSSEFPLLVEDKNHHAAVSPFGWPGEPSQSRNHGPVDDVIVFPAGGIFALALWGREASEVTGL